MSVVSPETYKQFELIGNGSSSEGYALYQINNMNISGLLITNLALLIIYVMGPHLKSHFKILNVSKTIEIGNKEFTIYFDVQETIITMLFIINFSTLFVREIINVL